MTTTEDPARLTAYRVPCVLGDRWVLRRQSDGQIEYSGFDTEAEAADFAAAIARALASK